MTILGRGDLSPPRRHRTRRRWPLLVVALAVLAAGAYAGWRVLGDDRGGTPARQTLRPCVTPSPVPPPAAAGQVRVAVLNATKRDGLAHRVAGTFHARGFRIGHVGNTAVTVTGVGQVVFGPGQDSSARAVAEQVPGATLVRHPQAGVALVIGPSFRGLATPAQAAATHQADLVAASPRPPSCPAS